MFEYIFLGKRYNDTNREYMLNLGMTESQIDSVLDQQAFELKQNVKRRRAAYARESDPLFIESQIEGTDESRQRWLDKVREIKERFPLSLA
ncbi:hypothetical protein [Pseudoalteromonas luteoviolacea]|uniref:hypothetical protein n=1 Tax=Pseudoalteromonas luteoviolacea TaxID=43657 RepID=UPI001150D917|nr:hypothetical protein [Pseudoalteromonas luteoviolacea]TQF71806.1 hypothetical protein FLM44_12290 [Pseudoalteromonas luteoviolacea]